MPTRRKPKPWNVITDVLPLPAATRQALVQNLEAFLEALYGPLASARRVDTEKVMEYFREVINANQSYLAIKSHLLARPRPREQKATFDALQYHGHTTAELLRHLQADSVTFMALETATRPQHPLLRHSLDDRATRPTHDESLRTFLSNIEGHLDLLCVLLQKTGRTLTRKEGASKLSRAGHEAFKLYIAWLADIYTRTTGGKATGGTYTQYVDTNGKPGWTYKGQFVDFVTACLRPIDPEICTPALGKRIQRALSDGKPRRESKRTKLRQK